MLLRVCESILAPFDFDHLDDIRVFADVSVVFSPFDDTDSVWVLFLC